jgi:hypothetical protein
MRKRSSEGQVPSAKRDDDVHYVCLVTLLYIRFIPSSAITEVKNILGHFHIHLTSFKRRDVLIRRFPFLQHLITRGLTWLAWGNMEMRSQLFVSIFCEWVYECEEFSRTCISFTPRNFFFEMQV